MLSHDAGTVLPDRSSPVACIFVLAFGVLSLQETEQTGSRWFMGAFLWLMVMAGIGFWIPHAPNPYLTVTFPLPSCWGAAFSLYGFECDLSHGHDIARGQASLRAGPVNLSAIHLQDRRQRMAGRGYQSCRSQRGSCPLVSLVVGTIIHLLMGCFVAAHGGLHRGGSQRKSEIAVLSAIHNRHGFYRHVMHGDR
ncbi:hypothetical protein ACFO1V_10605 [Daeguia caeni]|uniref:Uncharacterized protein n=1 Tax=Daeguia caeni TaxID=439612 RepID=A0ABV9H600_9HYPH